MSPTASQTIVCCYHYPCCDGIFSALAAHLHHEQLGKAVRFVPLTVYAPKLEDLQLEGGELVYFCDFVGPEGFAQQVAAQAARVVVLDHHKTSMEQLQAPGVVLPPNMELTLDMQRSGATIALDHFQPRVDDNLRQAFRLVEDADLWRWALPDAKAYHSGFAALHLELDIRKNPTVFDQILALDTQEVIRSGAEALRQQAEAIAAALSAAVEVQLGGAAGLARGWGRCLAVAPAAGDTSGAGGFHRSAIGNALAEAGRDRGLTAIGVVAYCEAGMADQPDQIKLSLRGWGDDVDTTTITQAYGGGGHRLASSCLLPLVDWASWGGLMMSGVSGQERGHQGGRGHVHGSLAQ